MILFLSITSVVLLLLLLIAGWFLLKFGMIILNVVDAIEKSLSVLDEKHASMTRILQIPLFSDSEEIRSVVNDIYSCRESVLRIAKLLSTVEMIDDESDQQ